MVMSNSSSNSITNSTVSSESAPRSLTKEVSLVTWSLETPICSLTISITRSSTDTGKPPRLRAVPRIQLVRARRNGRDIQVSQFGRRQDRAARTTIDRVEGLSAEDREPPETEAPRRRNEQPNGPRSPKTRINLASPTLNVHRTSDRKSTRL